MEPVQILYMGLLICIHHAQRDSNKTNKTSVFKNACFLDFCFENAWNSVISNLIYKNIVEKTEISQIVIYSSQDMT